MMLWGRLVITAITAAVPQAALAQTAPQESVVVKASPSCAAQNPDGSRSLGMDCLNAQLEKAISSVAPVPDLKALDAAGRGNPEQAGTFSFTAQAIRMGSNFGKSVIPQRPAPPLFANPLIGGGK